jgi:hypothetical protein
MAIDFDSFVRWAEDRFNGEVIVKGNEVKINSIFTDDHKYHLWCNPYGGKHRRENGCYRCFKTENRGTLTGLVMLVDGCTYEEAQDILSGQTSIRVLEERLHEFFSNKENAPQQRPESNLKLPEDCCLISEMSQTSYYRMEAEDYMKTRKLPIDGLMYCTHGEYRNRIIIPYYDHTGKLIYFNGRHVNPKAKLRYMGPPKSVGVGKGDVIYCPGVWPKAGEKVHLTEGEFNALTLLLCGFNSLACGGKTLSDKQLDMIRGYKVCLCLDQDDDSKAPGYQHAASPGFQAMLEMARRLISAFVPVSFVRPPKGYKDWNDMLVALGRTVITEYINRHEKPLDPLTMEQLMCLS